jgi:Pyruvate/2-oxoacid:ferredoxin oxidoreductase delta subunit
MKRMIVGVNVIGMTEFVREDRKNTQRMGQGEGRLYLLYCWDYGYNTCDCPRLTSQGRSDCSQNSTSNKPQRSNREIIYRYCEGYGHIEHVCPKWDLHSDLAYDEFSKSFELLKEHFDKKTKILNCNQ